MLSSLQVRCRVYQCHNIAVHPSGPPLDRPAPSLAGALGFAACVLVTGQGPGPPPALSSRLPDGA
eukprot:758903-Lingulodinium_polyedra.AAC.1